MKVVGIVLVVTLVFACALMPAHAIPAPGVTHTSAHAAQCVATGTRLPGRVSNRYLRVYFPFITHH